MVVEAAASLPKRDRHSTCDTYARVCLLAPAAAAAAGDEDDEADEGDAGRAPRAVVAEGRTAVSCGRDGGGRFKVWRRRAGPAAASTERALEALSAESPGRRWPGAGERRRLAARAAGARLYFFHNHFHTFLYDP